MRLVPSSVRETESESGATDESKPGLRLRRVAEGTKGGLIATLVMTCYRLPIARSLPPTAEFWATYVSGGEPDDHPLAALVLHLFYGAVGGAAFGVLGALGWLSSARRLDADRDDRRTARSEFVGLLEGVGYALALSAFGERVVLGRVLGMDLDLDESFVFHVGHVVYGLTLGTWLGSRTADE